MSGLISTGNVWNANSVSLLRKLSKTRTSVLRLAWWIALIPHLLETDLKRKGPLRIWEGKISRVYDRMQRRMETWPMRVTENACNLPQSWNYPKVVTVKKKITDRMVYVEKSHDRISSFFIQKMNVPIFIQEMKPPIFVQEMKSCDNHLISVYITLGHAHQMHAQLIYLNVLYVLFACNVSALWQGIILHF